MRFPDVALPPNAAPLECLKCGKTMDLSGDHASSSAGSISESVGAS